MSLCVCCFRTSSSRCTESPRDDEVVIVVPTDREDTPPRIVTDSSGNVKHFLYYRRLLCRGNLVLYIYDSYFFNKRILQINCIL